MDFSFFLRQGSLVEWLHSQVGSESWNWIHFPNKDLNLQDPVKCLEMCKKSGINSNSYENETQIALQHKIIYIIYSHSLPSPSSLVLQGWETWDRVLAGEFTKVKLLFVPKDTVSNTSFTQEKCKTRFT